MNLNTEQVCAELHIERHKLYQLIELGLIRGFKAGKTWVVPEKEVERFAEWAIGKNLGTRDHMLYWSRQMKKASETW